MVAQSYFQLLTPMTLVVFSIMFFSMGMYAPNKRVPTLLGISYLFGAMALLIEIFRDSFEPAVVTFTSVPLYAATAVVFVWGIAERYERPMPWKVIGGICAAVLTGLALGTFWQNSMTARSVISNTLIGSIFCCGVVLIWRAKLQTIDRFIFFCLTLSSIQFLVRGGAVAFFLDAPLTAETYSQSVVATTFYFSVTVAAICLAVGLLMAIGMDIVRHLQHDTLIDPLSKLFNRRGFDAAFDEMTHNNQFNSSLNTVVVCDLDHFKVVNDRHGHSAGDTVIKTIAHILKETAPEGAAIARLGGEEFGVLIPNSNMKSARLYAETVRQALSQQRIACVRGERQTASFGVAVCRKGASLADGLRAADLALYVAKDKGRDCVCLASETKEDLEEASQDTVLQKSAS